jgi:8-oxo-dGTP pyrophosphatase MutT (NUDIX family)
MVFPKAFQSYVPRSYCVTSHVYGAILVNPYNETVVIRGRQSGKWSFPKGHGQSKELPIEACIRELKEETGIDLKGVSPDDEIRFRSGTYFVFFVGDRLPLIPEDVKEVVEAMWTPLYRLSYLTGNKDLTSFSRCISISNILNKMNMKVM